jgi:hypothetical protein
MTIPYKNYHSKLFRLLNSGIEFMMKCKPMAKFYMIEMLFDDNIDDNLKKVAEVRGNYFDVFCINCGTLVKLMRHLQEFEASGNREMADYLKEHQKMYNNIMHRLYQDYVAIGDKCSILITAKKIMDCGLELTQSQPHA